MDSPEIWSTALESGREKKCHHATSHSDGDIELWLWHDGRVLEEKMNSLEEQQGQEIQQVVCVFILSISSASPINPSASRDSPADISQDRAVTPWKRGSPSHSRLA